LAESAGKEDPEPNISMGSTGLLKASNGDLVHREMSCKGDGITVNPLGEVFPLLVTHGEDIVDSITVDLGTC
jgi:hypothetical protein